MKRWSRWIFLLAAVLPILTGCGGTQEDADPALEVAADLLGTIQGDTYSNTVFGLGFDLGEGWEFMNDDETHRDNLEKAAAFLDAMYPSDAVSASDWIYLFSARESTAGSDAASYSSVGVSFTGLDAYGEEAETVSQEELGEIERYAAVQTALLFASEEEIRSGIRDQVVAGEEVSSGWVSITIPGTDRTMWVSRMILLRDTAMIEITITCVGEDRTEEILGMFHPV